MVAARAGLANDVALRRARARACAEVLQQWYQPEKGVWKTTSWWNAANALDSPRALHQADR